MPSLFRRLKALWKNEPPAPQPPTEKIPHTPTVLPPAPDVAPQAVPPPPDPSQPLSEDLVYQALRKCRDPEIPVNIVDLGLIYDVRIAESLVNVKMTLTTQGCGMGS